MEEKSFSSELEDYLKQKLKELREWLRPLPEDPVYLKIIKGIYKGIAVLILTILSPVILLFLIITFFAAF